MVGQAMGPKFGSKHSAWYSAGGCFWNGACDLVGGQRTFKMSGFALKITSASAALYGIGFAIPVFRDFAATWVWLGTLLFYFLLTLLLYAWLKSAYKKSSMRFIAAVNGATAIKMLTSLALVTTYLVAVGGEYRIQFAMGLFVAFAANTFFLVAEAQKLSKERLD